MAFGSGTERATATQATAQIKCAPAKKSAPSLYGNITLDQLGKCNADQLKSFVHVREFTSIKPSRPWPKNKGKTTDAEAGTDCLLLRAFNCRADIPKITEADVL